MRSVLTGKTRNGITVALVLLVVLFGGLLSATIAVSYLHTKPEVVSYHVDESAPMQAFQIPDERPGVAPISTSPNARPEYVAVNSVYCIGSKVFGYSSSVTLEERVQGDDGDSIREYEFLLKAMAGYRVGRNEAVMIGPKGTGDLTSLRASRDQITELITIEKCQGLSAFANNLLVLPPGKTLSGPGDERIKLFDVVENRGFLPAECPVSFAAETVDVAGVRLARISFASAPFSCRLISSPGRSAECVVRGEAVFDAGRRRLVHAVYSFRASIGGGTLPETFEERHLIFEADPATGKPKLPFDAHPRLLAGLDSVWRMQVPLSLQPTEVAPDWLGQMGLLSRVACISTSYAAERRSNPLPILAIIGAIYVADAVTTMVSDWLDDGKMNGTGLDLTQTVWRGVFKGGARLLGIDPKYDKYVQAAADIGDLILDLVSTHALASEGAITTMEETKATPLHYYLWGKAGQGAAWARYASKGLPVLDVAKAVADSKLLWPYQAADYWRTGEDVVNAFGSERGQSVVILFDTSSSMDEKTSGGIRKIDVAKKAAVEVLGSVVAGQELEWALFVFGNSKPRLAVPFRAEPGELITAVSAAVPSGNTPLAQTMRAAADYASNEGRYAQARLIILSDGEDTCGGDPVKEAERLNIEINRPPALPWPQDRVGSLGVPVREGIASAGYGEFAGVSDAAADPAQMLLAQLQKKLARQLGRLAITVIGLDVDGSHAEKQLKAIAGAGGGDYISVAHIDQLGVVLRGVMSRSGIVLGQDPFAPPRTREGGADPWKAAAIVVLCVTTTAMGVTVFFLLRRGLRLRRTRSCPRGQRALLEKGGRS